MSATRCVVVLAPRLVAGSLACGVLRPHPRWSNMTMRKRRASYGARIAGRLPPPGPPCTTTSGTPSGFPYSAHQTCWPSPTGRRPSAVGSPSSTSLTPPTTWAAADRFRPWSGPWPWTAGSSCSVAAAGRKRRMRAPRPPRRSAAFGSDCTPERDLHDGRHRQEGDPAAVQMHGVGGEGDPRSRSASSDS